MKREKRGGGGGGGGNNWLWRDMYSVAEEEEEDLTDFGLHHLVPDEHYNRHHSQQHHQHPFHHDNNEYHAPLLDNDHTVDDIICNPMEESIITSSQRRRQLQNPLQHYPDNENNIDEASGAFVLLKRLKLLPKNNGYAYVSDLDAFFSSLYNYYFMRGLGAIVGKGVVEIISLFFTLWLSLVLFAYIDWRGLSQCNDENTCHDSFMESYIIHNPFSSGGSVMRNSWIVMYCLLFSAYGFVCLMQFGHTVAASLECKIFLEEVLGVSDRDLEVGGVEWGDIVDRMSAAQRMGKCRVAILPGRMGNGGNYDAAAATQSRISASTNAQEEDIDCPTGHLVVAQRIMRRENYMIAFINMGLLDLTIPNFPGRMWPLTLLTNKSKDEKTALFSKSIEWSIYFCVLNYMFNHSRKVRPAFYGDPTSLRRRFVFCGVAHAVFMPFLLFFVTLHFFMSNVYDWQSTKEYFGPREWSSMARWTFREFNELPHSFERRIAPSYKSASAYIDMFGRPSPLKVAVGRLLVFVSGSLGTLLLTFAAINDAILLHVKIGQWNLLWFAGIVAACFSVGKGMLPDVNNPHLGHARRNLINDMNLELENLATFTHFLPDSWRGKAADDKTKKLFSSMFQYKANHFAMEILSIMAAPLILCVSLPRCADKLCSFVRDSKVEVPSVGDVVGYSTFDFDSFEDENWRGKGDLDHSSRVYLGNTDELAHNANDRPKSRHGKMEKSFFNFKSVYPNWKMLPSGKNLVNKIEAFRQCQDMALARERRLHIEAAAAQLETLRRLEIDRERRASAGGAGPDSGGGGVRYVNFSDDALSDLSLPQYDSSRHQRGHFEESAPSIAPPIHAFAHSSIIQGDDYSPRQLSHSEYASNSHAERSVSDLSVELRGLLNGSTLLFDPTASQQSFTGSLVPIDDQSTSILEVPSDRQVIPC